MKSLRKIIIAGIILTGISFNAAALNSAAYEGSAQTIEDDVYSLMNILTWNKLKFENFYGFTNINSVSSGNLAFAFRTKNKNMGGIAWQGNLWSESSDNSISGFYGWNKYAIKITLNEQISPAWYLDSNFCENYKNLGGIIDFGCNLNKTVSYTLSIGYSNITGKINPSQINYSTFLAGGSLFYTLKDEKSINSKLFVDYSGNFAFKSSKNGNKETKTTYNQNEMTLGTVFLYKPNTTLTYGLKAFIPVTITAGDNIKLKTNIAFEVSNGLSFVLKPDTVLLNTGIHLSLPSFTIEEDEDTVTGNFYTTFYAGLSLILGSNINIDICTDFNPTNGISPSDIWTQNFKISVAARF